MAFTSVPFTGSLSLDAMNFSWCSVTPTKGFLIYAGNTGGTPNTRKLFIQAVYFNGKAAPTYGPACAVGNLSYTSYLQISIVSITDGRLVVTMKEDVTSFSYSVYDVDASDQVSLAFKHPTLYSQATNIAVPMATLNNNKVLSCYLANLSTNAYHVLTVGTDTLTVATVTSGSLTTRSTSGYSVLYTPTALIDHSIKRDRNGNILVARAVIGANYSSYLTNGICLTSFNKDGAVLYAGQMEPSQTGGVEATGCQKGREIIPVRANIMLDLGATDSSGQGSINGINTFAKIILGSTGDARLNGVYDPIPYRDFAPVLFHDAIWLDQDYFFALATSAPSGYNGIRNGASWSATAINAMAEVAYIGKYNEASNSVVMSDNMPLALPNKTYNGTPVSNFLHRISNTEVAILQAAWVQSSLYELNITVVGA